MKEYMKMSDVFSGDVFASGCKAAVSGVDGCKYSDVFISTGSKEADYIAHAINSHDELVQMNKELLSALEALFHETNQQNLSAADRVIAKAKGGAI
jgi:hypothetical protein